MQKIKEFQVLISCLLVCLVVLISSLIFASKIQRNENITVTGSAYKIVTSDSAKLTVQVKTKAPNLKDAYEKMKVQQPKVVDYLLSKGIDKKDIEIKTFGGYYNYKSLPGGGTNMNEPVS